MKNNTFEVNLTRGNTIETTHKVHAVVSDKKGRLLMAAGNPNYKTFIRSALKPFQAIPFISSGAAEKINCGDKGIAISCGSHTGTINHARQVFNILWNSELEAINLKCPIPKNNDSPLNHNCSGKHAAFLSTCKKMRWSIEDYLEGQHPLQQEINRRVKEILNIKNEDLIAARDNCGAPTLLLKIIQMSTLYANLGSSNQPELEKICRAMIAFPELVSGEGEFDTELMRSSHGQLISKGGSEGIQCISRLGKELGIAIKVEDGAKRAKQAVALHILRQLDWLTPTGLEELEQKILLLSPGVQLEVIGDLKFQ